MAHSFIAHVHEEQTAFHGHHDNDHHQDKHDKNEHTPQNVFGFFHHSEATGNSFLSAKKIDFNFQKILLTQSLFIAVSFQLPQTEGPPLFLYHKLDLFTLPKAKAYFFLLKAPPSDASVA